MLRTFILFIAAIICINNVNASTAPATKTLFPKSKGSSKGDFVGNILSTVVDATKGQSISASIKDTSATGIQGLDLKWDVPINIKDNIIGFKYSLSEFKKVPDVIFAKRTFATGSEGVASINAEYSVEDKVFSASTQWTSERLGLNLRLAGDSVDKLTTAGFSTQHAVKDTIVKSSATYDVKEKKAFVTSKVSSAVGSVEVQFDTKVQNPIVTIAKTLDSKNEIAPSISLKTGDLSYKWTRTFDGGKLAASFHPGDNLVLEWADRGDNGEWVTKANIPLKNQAASKVSFSRNWKF